MIDIDSLAPGLELDVLVAEKVMGWNVYFTDPELRGGRVHWRDAEHSTCYLPGQWSPSTNIATAWTVHEEMQNRDILAYADSEAFDLYCSAEEACLRICRAALKAVI